MNYINKCKNILKDSGGIITTKALKENNIPTIYLTRMIENGDIIRVSRGIYINENGDYDEYFFLNERYKNIVFSYVSALYLLNFTDIIPQNMEVTVYSGFNAHRIKKNIYIHYVKKEILELGKIEVKTMYGNIVRCYDIERCICDFVANRKDIEVELFSKTINNYIRYKNKNMNKLYQYSKKMNIFDKVSSIMEIVYE